MDSTPAAEELETEMKASALLEALDASAESATPEPVAEVEPVRSGVGHRILFLDHEDSFVQMLAGYMRETGAEVRTVRIPKGGIERAEMARILDEQQPSLVVMSPGPGAPSDFRSAELLDEIVERSLPVFGVCLGQQAIGEYFGASLGQLGYPLHGQEREVVVTNPGFLDALPERFVTGRYHSLHIDPATMPESLVLVASDDDGIPMAIQHRELPIFAVQFHPESLMTLRDSAGKRIIEAVMERIPARVPAA